jgi:N-acetylmuramoyl-L-alanine amidase
MHYSFLVPPNPLPRPLPKLALTAALAFAGIILHAQNRNLIVLDPAHGGQDAGPNLNGQPEKAITLALATNLKSNLTALGFTVVSTRETDLPDSAPLLTTDQRAGTANHLRPIACLIIHAASSGSGVHLITSSLPQSDVPHEVGAAIPWETLQDDYIDRSQRLANDLGLALVHAKIPALLVRATLRPLDNLTCPALAIEVAPLPGNPRLIPVTDSGYQQRLADTIAGALLTWRDATSPRPAPKPAPTPASAAAGGPTP